MLLLIIKMLLLQFVIRSMYFNEKKNYFLSKNLIFRYKDKQTGTLVYDHPSEKYNVGIQEEEMIVCIFTGL